jgi:hypothetical protein
MTIAVEDALVGENAVGGDKIVDFDGVDRAAGLRIGCGTFVVHVRFLELSGVSGDLNLANSCMTAKSSTGPPRSVEL